MVLSDLSIRRPVLATVMSLLLIVIGLIAYSQLTLRELPDIDPPVVSVQTEYPGASAAVVESRITQIIEDAVAGIEGVDTIESSSRNGRSDVSLEFTLGRDIESAANDVRDAVSRVVDRLPDEAEAPQVAKVSADAEPIMFLNLASPRLDILALTDFAERNVIDRLSSIPGVASVRLGGGQRYAMRVWLDRSALAARGLTVNDVEAALRRENVELPAGRLESSARDFTLRMSRAYRTPEDFRALVVTTGREGRPVRLGDVARVDREAAERRAWFRGNGQPQVGFQVIKTSTANAIEVAQAVRAEVEVINRTLPADVTLGVSFDSTEFIEVAVERVWWTLGEALALVLVVILVFLGSMRAALVPAVTLPVCITASFIALWLFGYSINLLTLLAIVLSIGLVVDDAIVVLENCQRRVDLGEPRLVAARRGTRQVAFAVIATTAVLVAVFVPMAFLQGNNGRLFRELAVALAGAIAISAFVALTLTPMMCSLLLKAHQPASGGIAARIDRLLNRVTSAYRRSLDRQVDRAGVFAGIVVAAVVATLGLFVLVPKELAPPEDRGSFFVSVAGPEGAGFDYTVGQMQQVESILLRGLGEDEPLHRVIARVPGGFGGGINEEMHTGNSIVILRPWDERDVTTNDVVNRFRGELAAVPGVVARPIARSGLTRSRGGQQFQVVLGGPDYAELAQWRDALLKEMESNPQMFGADSDYQETRPQLRIDINRERAAALGVSVQDIGRTLETMMGSRRVGTYVEGGEEYDVILQAQARDRATPGDLANLYVRSSAGQLIPLASLVTLRELAEPGSLNRFNRLRAITVSASLAPGYTLGEATAWVEAAAERVLPPNAQLGWKGEAREQQQSSAEVYFAFAMALLIVYLVLAAQFESFAHPFVIMLTVPLAVLGALFGLWSMGLLAAIGWWGPGASLNLFSQIGLIMLVGLAAKNGILIVEFANQLRDEGRNVRDAILEASAVRLRPILMTSIATIAGALPLMFGGGAGSASRNSIGIVIVFGVALSTLLTLYVIPALYARVAPYTTAPEARGRELERLEGLHADGEARA
ncbi:MAG: efflux RND transporter permease subunit [Lysobacteraceae bacterium]